MCNVKRKTQNWLVGGGGRLSDVGGAKRTARVIRSEAKNLIRTMIATTHDLQVKGTFFLYICFRRQQIQRVSHWKTTSR